MNRLTLFYKHNQVPGLLFNLTDYRGGEWAIARFINTNKGKVIPIAIIRNSKEVI